MATTNGVYVPECANCHNLGNLACMGCLLVTVSCPHRSTWRPVTNVRKVLRQNLPNRPLETPQAGLQVPPTTAALETAIRKRFSQAHLCRRPKATSRVLENQEVPLGSHAKYRHRQARRQ